MEREPGVKHEGVGWTRKVTRPELAKARWSRTEVLCLVGGSPSQRPPHQHFQKSWRVAAGEGLIPGDAGLRLDLEETPRH